MLKILYLNYGYFVIKKTIILLTLSLLEATFCHQLKTFSNSLDPDQDQQSTLVLIWIQSIRHPDSVPENINFEKISR